MLLMLLFCFVVIILILCFIKIGTNKEINKYIHFESKDEILNLSSGDLVFVAYNNSLGKISKFWHGSKWTHVGMVYRDNQDEMFILEVAEYNTSKFDKGVTKIPVRSWLELNKYSEITYRKLDLDLESEKLYSLYLKYKDKKLHKLGLNPKKFKKYLFPVGEDKEALSCNELVVKILEDLTFIPKDTYYSTPELMNIKF
jgi:hypothetical protein